MQENYLILAFPSIMKVKMYSLITLCLSHKLNKNLKGSNNVDFNSLRVICSILWGF